MAELKDHGLRKVWKDKMKPRSSGVIMQIIESFKRLASNTKFLYALRLLGMVMMVINLLKGQSLSLTLIAFVLFLAPNIARGSKCECVTAVTAIIGAAIIAFYGIFSESGGLAFIVFAIITAGFFHLYDLWAYGYDHKNERGG